MPPGPSNDGTHVVRTLDRRRRQRRDAEDGHGRDRHAASAGDPGTFLRGLATLLHWRRRRRLRAVPVLARRRRLVDHRLRRPRPPAVVEHDHRRRRPLRPARSSPTRPATLQTSSSLACPRRSTTAPSGSSLPRPRARTSPAPSRSTPLRPAASSTRLRCLGRPLEVKPAGAGAFGVVGTQTVPVVGSTYRLTLTTTALADGPADLRVVVTDVAGNETTSATRTINVDNDAPVVTLDDPGAAVGASVGLRRPRPPASRASPSAIAPSATPARARQSARTQRRPSASPGRPTRRRAAVGADRGCRRRRRRRHHQRAAHRPRRPDAARRSRHRAGERRDRRRPRGGPRRECRGHRRLGRRAGRVAVQDSGAGSFSAGGNRRRGSVRRHVELDERARRRRAGPRPHRRRRQRALHVRRHGHGRLDRAERDARRSGRRPLRHGRAERDHRRRRHSGHVRSPARPMRARGRRSARTRARRSPVPFDTTALADGLYDLSAIGYDSLGNASTASLREDVRLDNTAPWLVSSAPADGSTSSSANQIVLTASEPVTAPGALLDGAPGSRADGLRQPADLRHGRARRRTARARGRAAGRERHTRPLPRRRHCRGSPPPTRRRSSAT